ncbi:MAG: sugar ABC transporter, partial [SAR324 cluster bacterium]|nr:sugar ABC transporter [SAR324 cluster bacterium]
VGSPSINLVPGKLEKNGKGFNFVPDQQPDGFNIPINGYAFENSPQEGQPVILGLRPEHINLSNTFQDAHLDLELKPTLIELTGYEQNVTFDFQGYEVTGRLPRNAQAELGSPLSLSLDLSEISLFDKETSFRI